jgi:hypothetical protein
LLSANSNPKVDRYQVTSEAVDFQLHPEVFADLDQEMDLTIGSLNFHIGSLGTTRLPDPMKSGPSAVKTASEAMSESSAGSSSEVNSLVSFTPTKTAECTIEELDEIMENLDLGETSDHSDKGSSENFGKGTTADFTTRDGGVSDSDESTWRSEERYINNIHQVCVIITEVAEDDDGRSNLVINAQGGNPGVGALGQGVLAPVARPAQRGERIRTHRSAAGPKHCRPVGHRFPAAKSHSQAHLQEEDEYRRCPGYKQPGPWHTSLTGGGREPVESNAESGAPMAW